MILRLAIVLVIWAATYLPWLGAPEYYSEEGHRVMPALEMLDSGNFLVPTVAGQIYFSKPPLLNWLIAGSFQAFGRSEWSARIVSALAVLIAALVFLFATRRELGATGALLAAVVWLTNFALIEKGRMAEIEALYSAIFAIALVAWLKLWRSRRAPWLTWIVPFVFLGFGLLAKGPADVVFFYCIVVATLRFAGRLKELLHPAHLVGVAIMLAIFGAWALPYQLAVRGISVSHEWSHEIVSPLLGHYERSNDWSMNFPRGAAYFLPWAILLPFLRFNRIAPPRDRAVARGLVWGSSIPWMVLLLLPYTFPRYVIPLVAPMCWLIALAVKENAFDWRLPTLQLRVPPRPIIGFVAVTCLAAIILWPAFGSAGLRKKPKLKARAAQIDAKVPPNESIFVWNPDFQPYLIYVHAPIRYLHTLDDLPADARYLITDRANLPTIERDPRWSSSRPIVLQETESYRQLSTVLLQLAP